MGLIFQESATSVLQGIFLECSLIRATTSEGTAAGATGLAHSPLSRVQSQDCCCELDIVQARVVHIPKNERPRRDMSNALRKMIPCKRSRTLPNSPTEECRLFSPFLPRMERGCGRHLPGACSEAQPYGAPCLFRAGTTLHCQTPCIWLPPGSDLCMHVLLCGIVSQSHDAGLSRIHPASPAVNLHEAFLL